MRKYDDPGCKFNPQGIRCNRCERCSRCGWNPSVSDARKNRLVTVILSNGSNRVMLREDAERLAKDDPSIKII